MKSSGASRARVFAIVMQRDRRRPTAPGLFDTERMRYLPSIPDGSSNRRRSPLEREWQPYFTLDDRRRRARSPWPLQRRPQRRLLRAWREPIRRARARPAELDADMLVELVNDVRYAHAEPDRTRRTVTCTMPSGRSPPRRRPARGAEPGPARGRVRARRSAPRRRRRGIGQDARAHPPHRVPHRRAARLAVRARSRSRSPTRPRAR